MTPRYDHRTPAPASTGSPSAHPPPPTPRREAPRAPDAAADRARTSPHDDEHESGYGHGV